MAIVLSAPTHSFVQINDPATLQCAHPVGLCLPYSSSSDFSFQIIATVTGDDKTWFQQHDGTFLYTILPKTCIDCANAAAGPLLPNSFPWRATWRRTVTGDTDVWIGNFDTTAGDALFDTYPMGQCFNLCFHKAGLNDDLSIGNLTTTSIACTDTCFVKTDGEDCFTSYFSYYNREDSMSFIYTDAAGEQNFQNTVRLPCYLRDMQLPSEEKSYVRSDGTKIKLYERIEEEYELVTDHMYHTWHKRLKVLLAHDRITIRNSYMAGYLQSWPIICKEKYDIQWPDMPSQVATAKTKVIRSGALSLINNNCA